MKQQMFAYDEEGIRLVKEARQKLATKRLASTFSSVVYHRCRGVLRVRVFLSFTHTFRAEFVQLLDNLSQQLLAQASSR